MSVWHEIRCACPWKVMDVEEKAVRAWWEHLINVHGATAEELGDDRTYRLVLWRVTEEERVMRALAGEKRQRGWQWEQKHPPVLPGGRKELGDGGEH